jgi:hypothetical protein
MTSPSDLVQIPQSTIDAWTASVTSVGTDISTAASVLGPYIQQLLANQATPLPAAQVAEIQAALGALQNADTALQGLEPAPPPPPPPAGPSVTAVANATTGGAGTDAGGDTVTVTGSGFTGATDVQFGGVSAQSFNVDSDTQVTAVSPAGSPGTSVDVTVVTPAGTSAASAADQFSYA